MEASNEEKIDSNRDMDSETTGLSLDFQARLKFEMMSRFGDVTVSEEDGAVDDLSDCEHEEEEEEEEGEEEEEDEEFTFGYGGELPSPVAAEDAFANGQIKTVFPLFNQELLFSSGDSNSLIGDLPITSAVKKVFVETSEESTPAASSSAGNDEIAGPYCEWSNRKAVEASDQSCKKSNSTGFSKIWRFKEFVARCNSDGRDAFVFLNNNAHPPRPQSAKKKPAAEAKAEESAAVKITQKEKKSGKSKTTPLSAHEVYLRNKKKDGQRRKPSYMPYRPELIGIFTTVNGGFTKNVHPY